MNNMPESPVSPSPSSSQYSDMEMKTLETEPAHLVNPFKGGLLFVLLLFVFVVLCFQIVRLFLARMDWFSRLPFFFLMMMNILLFINMI